MRTHAQHLGWDAQIDVPVQALFTPVLVPLWTFFGWNEELKFHLFKFTRTEDEVSWSDFVSEALTYLRNTKGRLFAAGLQNIHEVHKHALCGFWAHIHIGTRTLNGPGMSFEHQVECARSRELTALHALWAITCF